MHPKRSSLDKRRKQIIRGNKNVSFLAEQNKLKATNSKESGLHKVAKMYDVISKRNFNRLEALKQEKNINLIFTWKT